ncbi:MAG TPA: hypothetical protein VMB52_01150 [Verrucomicrobiae bacterium]|nr:hypothetical protein [Verrucomicrobiae bacterium]
MIILIVIGLSILERPNITQKYAVPKSFTSAVGFGSNTAVFSNGNELATYNYTTGKVRNISAAVGLGIIDTISVSPSDNYIVFHGDQVSQNGQLANQLEAGGLSPVTDYWWVYNVRTNTFHYLPQNVLIAEADNTQIYALAYDTDGSGETITTYQASNMQSSTTISVPGSTDFFVTHTGFLLQTPNNTILKTTNGIVNQQLFSNAVLTGVSQDGENAVAVVTQDGDRDLVVINLETNNIKVVTKNIINNPVWLNPNIALYATKTGGLYTYNLTTHKQSAWRFGSKLSSLKPLTLQLTGIIGPNAAIVTDTFGNSYLIGSKLIPASTL